MTTMDIRKLFASIVLLAWLSQIVYLVAPLLNDSIAKTGESFQSIAEQNPSALQRLKDDRQLDEKAKPEDVADQITIGLWVNWTVYTAMVVAGIVAGVLAFLNVRFWRPLVVITSVLYLIGWWQTQALIFSPISLGEALKMKWNIAVQFAGVTTLMHREVLLPIIYLLAIVWAFRVPSIFGNRALS